MLIMKYIGLKNEYEVEYSKLSSHIVQVKGDFPAKNKGFTLSRQGKEDTWDYSEYTTIYREVEGGVQFSNDGSVYVAPPEPEPQPEPEPYMPTEEELAALLAQNKRMRISESKQMLAEYLENHPITSSAHGGEEKVYSVTQEKQTLMMSQYMTYQIEKTVNPDAKLTWNETGKSCEEWTEAEFLQLILEVKAYVYPLVSYQQGIEEAINACLTQESLDAVVIDFDSAAGTEEGEI